MNGNIPPHFYGFEPSRAEYNVLFTARDPGGARAIAPIIAAIAQHAPEWAVAVVAEGYAVDTLAEVTDGQWSKAVGYSALRGLAEPDALVVAASTNIGLFGQIEGRYPNTPLVIIEDYYDSASQLLLEARDGRRRFPGRVCVIDEAARAIHVGRIEGIEESVVVTGQPAFDYLADTDNAATNRERAREALELDHKQLITCISGLEVVELTQRCADVLGWLGIEQDCAVVVSPHPRDSLSRKEYERLYADRGVEVLRVPANLNDRAVTLATDIGIGIPRSTRTLELAYSGASSVIHFGPGASGHISVKEGLAHAAVDKQKLGEQLIKALMGQLPIRHRQTDGGSAVRCLNQIQAVLNS